jgi:anion-transporting  ArsA/GET3 family ATPase
MAQFFVEFNTVLGGFRERAREVFEILRRPDVGFVLVASPEPLAIDEAIFFFERLVASHMPLGAFVVNRVHRRGPPAIGREALIGRLQARPELRGYSPDDVVQVAADLERTYREFQSLAAVDEREIARLKQASRGLAPLEEVPFFDHDIYDVEGLALMVEHLVGPA